MRPRSALALAAAVAAAVLAGLTAWGCDGAASPEETASVGHRDALALLARPAARRRPLVVAAGDIVCPPGAEPTPTECRQRDTARLTWYLRPDAVLGLGDLQYETGAPEEWPAFAATWGHFFDRLFPAPGNHEYATRGASGYFDYFGARAGPARRGYYSFNFAGWHFVSLNSVCYEQPCEPGSEQERWLRAVLAANPARCTLGFMHHPRFSSGFHGGDPAVGPLWKALQDAHGDVVLAGHDHDYERFGPQSDSGVAHPLGIREFVVGSGGKNVRPFERIAANSEVRDEEHFGVLALLLYPRGYRWFFVTTEPRIADHGAAVCRR